MDGVDCLNYGVAGINLFGASLFVPVIGEKTGVTPNRQANFEWCMCSKHWGIARCLDSQSLSGHPAAHHIFTPLCSSHFFCQTVQDKQNLAETFKTTPVCKHNHNNNNNNYHTHHSNNDNANDPSMPPEKASTFSVATSSTVAASLPSTTPVEEKP